MTAPGAFDPRAEGGDPREESRDPRQQTRDPGADPRPGVALPGTGLPTPLLIVLGVVLALALFLFLNARRQARLDVQDGQARASSQLPLNPPPLEIPPPPPAPAPVVIYLKRPAPPLAMMPPPPPLREPMPPPPQAMAEPSFAPPPPRAPAGSAGPALVVDLTAGSGAAVNGGEPGVPGAELDDTVRATLIRNRASVIPQGAIITAVLETPLDSDRPGLARAIVSQNARGFDGSRVLVPRGSRLFGEFRADPSPGMRRILITWTRLIRPDGVAIRIGSPVSDTMGGAGVPGQVNSHFLARFSSAVLQSALAVGVNLASQKSSSGSTVYLGLPAQSASVGQQLIPNVNRAPTVKVREGAEIAVMVAHDLDFSGTPLVR